MILIVTYKDDYTADFLINKLNQEGRKYLRLNTEDIEKYSYWNSSDFKFDFEVNGLKSFDGVWYRRLRLPELNTDTLIGSYLATEYDSLFSNLFRHINTKRWLSHPDALQRAENKVTQLKLASALGFNLPETLITNDRQHLKDFSRRHKDGGIVIKPLFSGRMESDDQLQLIYTNEVSEDHVNSLEQYDLTPCIFQRKVPKKYELRITIVDTQVFASRVNSQDHEKTRVDWRREKLQFSPYELPPEISAKCVTFVKSLNTSFGAIDLIKSTDGEYYFLENNPNGQWAWLEIETGVPITHAIIDFLYGQN
jgi:glutathione synthase/RimK-type ligase-like ATP-grasp enzyme